MPSLNPRLLVAILACLTTLARCAPSVVSDQKDGKWLLLELKGLADDGVLFDSDKTGHVLGLKFTGTERELVQQPASCSNPYGNSSMISSTYSDAANWYKSMPGGQPEKFPGFTINPPGETGDPKMSYRVTRTINCSGFSTVIHGMSARLGLEGLPSFACLRQSDIEQTIGAHYQLATDGVMLMTYSGRRNDNSGTSLQFLFRFGAQCALSAMLNQDVTEGYRFQRAKWKFDECARIERRKFCSNHAPFTWSQGEIIDEMNRAGIKVCGTVNSYFAREPRTGLEPPPMRPWSYPKTPCDMP